MGVTSLPGRLWLPRPPSPRSNPHVPLLVASWWRTLFRRWRFEPLMADGAALLSALAGHRQ